MKSPRVRFVVGCVAALSVAMYGALAAAAFFGQRALMYPAPLYAIEPRLEGASLERIAGPGGTTVYALYAKAPEKAPTIVHFHGNGEDLAGQAWLVHRLRKAGIGVYAVEYPGYGLAAGAPLGEEPIYDAAEAALEHLRTKLGVPRESIVLEGQSLGTGVATEMARRGLGARLVLLSPFTSMVDMAARVAPFLPTGWLVRDRYDTIHKAPALRIPALVVHGTSDEVVPFDMGRQVAALLPNAEFIAIPDGHHTDLFAADEALVAQIAAFARGAAAVRRVEGN
jgi:pimeloyl-ACP methyl ester carboxylesterase